MVKLFSFWRLGLRQWCSFNGRTPRSQFYAVFVLLLIAYILPDAWILWGSDMSEYERSLYSLVLTVNPSADWSGFGFSLFINTWHLLIAYMMLALGCRRLHDANHSGWWQLLLIPPVAHYNFNLYPVLILFLLFVWSRPTTALPNKYGDVSSLDSPISSPARKYYLFVLVYLSFSFLIPELYINLSRRKSDVIPSSFFVSATSPVEHTYLFYGDYEYIINELKEKDYSLGRELRKNVKFEPNYIVIRFIPHKPIGYGFTLIRGKEAQTFWKEYELPKDFKAILEGNLPWYKKLFFKYPSYYSGSTAGGAESLDPVLKEQYGIEVSTEELNQLLKEFIESETRKQENRKIGGL